MVVGYRVLERRHYHDENIRLVLLLLLHGHGLEPIPACNLVRGKEILKLHVVVSRLVDFEISKAVEECPERDVEFAVGKAGFGRLVTIYTRHRAWMGSACFFNR